MKTTIVLALLEKQVVNWNILSLHVGKLTSVPLKGLFLEIKKNNDYSKPAWTLQEQNWNR